MTDAAAWPVRPFDAAALEQVATEARACRACRLCEGRTQAVPGAGSGQSGILVVGEAPGGAEDRQGVPFVGPAGQVLDQLLTSIGLGRADLFITNVVKCRPPGNRDPLPEEIEACSGFLDRQIAALNPAVMVPLGRFALQAMLPGADPISRVHGRLLHRPRSAAEPAGSMLALIPLYHPAAALHQPGLMGDLRADMRALATAVRELRATRPAVPAPVVPAPPPEQDQMSLFQ